MSSQPQPVPAAVNTGTARLGDDKLNDIERECALLSALARLPPRPARPAAPSARTWKPMTSSWRFP